MTLTGTYSLMMIKGKMLLTGFSIIHLLGGSEISQIRLENVP